MVKIFTKALKHLQHYCISLQTVYHNNKRSFFLVFLPLPAAPTTTPPTAQTPQFALDPVWAFQTLKSDCTYSARYIKSTFETGLSFSVSAVSGFPSCRLEANLRGIWSLWSHTGLDLHWLMHLWSLVLSSDHLPEWIKPWCNVLCQISSGLFSVCWSSSVNLPNYKEKKKTGTQEEPGEFRLYFHLRWRMVLQEQTDFFFFFFHPAFSFCCWHFCVTEEEFMRESKAFSPQDGVSCCTLHSSHWSQSAALI